MIHRRLDDRLPGFRGLRYLVVGAGFFGAVIAERIAREKGLRVAVLEKRGHVGGNSHSEADPATGIEVHPYGSHIFHTRIGRVWDYVNRFGSFNAYRHRVLARYRDGVYPMPVSLWTINRFYGTDFTPAQAEAHLRAEIARAGIRHPANLEEKAISLVGRPLYEALIRGYTAKQWGRDPRDLPAHVIERLPVRFGYKTDYFDDPWQGVPLDGYGALFDRILSHEKIDVYLGTDFFDVRHLVPDDCRVVYTGQVDRYLDYRFGELRWRSLRFEREALPVRDFQGTAVMNFAEESVPYTRIHEFRHLHEERGRPPDRTVVMREYSRTWRRGEDPSYPVDTPGDRETLARYLAECAKEDRLILGGRLGTYRYLDMDRTIDAALSTYEEKIRDAEEPA